jgi:hypothetical protein
MRPTLPGLHFIRDSCSSSALPWRKDFALIIRSETDGRDRPEADLFALTAVDANCVAGRSERTQPYLNGKVGVLGTCPGGNRYFDEPDYCGV